MGATMKKLLLSLGLAAVFALPQPLLAKSQTAAAKPAAAPAEPAANAVANDDAIHKAIEEALKKAAPTLNITSVTPTKVPGLYEVVAGSKTFHMTGDGKYLLEGKLTDVAANRKATPVPGLYEFISGSKLYYTNEDGSYFVDGSLIDINANKDLTEARLGETRIAALDKIGLNNMIVFKPKKFKHAIYVFTDIDCGYCRKLHSEIDQYLNAGIEIRYLFFPRAGLGSDSYNKAVAVWCAKDRHAALTKAKKGEAIDMLQCDNPVQTHMKQGEEFGVSGTPMLVTEKGTIIPGYVNATSLAQGLEKEAKK
jgi:thiol:disulfide interchange protein DsbC